MGIEIRGNSKISDISALKLQNLQASRGTDFAAMLKSGIERKDADAIKFSKHASLRIEQRGIDISEGFVEKLKKAINDAQNKGANDIVVISNKGAFIVNVPNRTVVTGISETEMKENIFTNIDGAVVL